MTTRDALAATRVALGSDVGFVPTMGGLHAGHMALIAAARRRHSVVVASSYVNPLQFGADEDYAAYPRTPENDEALLAAASVDVAFFPDDAAIYPHGRQYQTQVWVPQLSDDLCGAFRPDHFRGVATVVARLLGLIQPRAVYFGKKDYQQWRLITRMVDDLALPITVVGIESVREVDGLALSTRNRYLTPTERAQAPALAQALRDGAQQAEQGAVLAQVERGVMSHLAARGWMPDYVAIRRQVDLAPPVASDADLVILAAARLGRTRLIDNCEFTRRTAADEGSLQGAPKAG
ncbi:MAG: pantoate--beta-alanine ligase [Acidiferrobacter sp.]